jgi:hypothetical protein
MKEINQNNVYGHQHGYWHEYSYTYLGYEHYHSGMYDNGIKNGMWIESVVINYEELDNYRVCLEDDILEGEAIDYNYY